MLAALLAVVAVAVLVTGGVLALLAVTVAPFLLSLWQGERLGASPVRVGAVAALACAVGLLLALSGLRAGAAAAAAAVPLLLPWTVPVALSRATARPAWLGRAGRHERSLQRVSSTR